MQEASKKLQILAPAGSIEQLVAAVNNGCDAVYLGLDSFNARMKAPNFTLNNLSEWVDYCHLFGVKVYVAINTSLKNNEFFKAVELLIGAYKQNVDGVIVTDIALMRLAGKLPKPFEVVASTQLNIHDKYGAEFVKKCGATTVVCARECNFDQIKEIASVGVGVECFLHGAMCVCQSGQCLFSSIVGGNSGNRGLCAQPCRKLYYAEGAANVSGYLLSARDMCSLDTAGKLAEIGVTTFKIEGRNRRAEYAGMTSRVYRRMFDNDFSPSGGDYSDLAEMFNRGMTANQYLIGKNGDIIYSSAQNHIGVEVGVVQRGKVNAFVELRKGDGLKIFDGKKEVCGGVVLENGIKSVNVQFSGKVSDGMKVNRTTSVTLCDEILSAKKQLDVKLTFTAKIGQRSVISAKCLDVEAVVAGDFTVEKAVNAPLKQEDIAKQLQKSGNTHYTISDIVINCDDIFIAKSQINALRRDVLDLLTKEIVKRYNQQFASREGIDGSFKAREYVESFYGKTLELISQSRKAVGVVAKCYNEQQLQQGAKLDGLIYKPDFIDNEAFRIAKEFGAYVDLPSFADLNLIEASLKENGAKLYCNNLGQVELARKVGVGYMVGSGLNIFNDYNVCEFPDAIDYVYSVELTVKEISEFRCRNGLTFVDGQISLMQLCHCPYKVAFGCDCSSCESDKRLVYRDERGNRFVVRRRRAGRCLFELVNGSKLSVVAKLGSAGRYLIDYNNAVAKHYVNLNNGIKDGYVEFEPYTKGRLYDKIN